MLDRHEVEQAFSALLDDADASEAIARALVRATEDCDYDKLSWRLVFLADDIMALHGMRPVARRGGIAA